MQSFIQWGFSFVLDNNGENMCKKCNHKEEIELSEKMFWLAILIIVIVGAIVCFLDCYCAKEKQIVGTAIDIYSFSPNNGYPPQSYIIVKTKELVAANFYTFKTDKIKTGFLTIGQPVIVYLSTGAISGAETIKQIIPIGHFIYP